MGFKYNRPDRCNTKDSYYWAKPLLDEYFNTLYFEFIIILKDSFFAINIY